MAEVILMPRLSDTMTEGVIAAWHKKVGDAVKKGDLLAEVETDKATMDLESYKDGTLLYVGTDKGGKIQVNDLLAIIGSNGEDISSLLPGGKTAAKSEAPAPAPQTATQAQQPASPATDLLKAEEVILMPRLSDTMTEGVIADWHKKVGDAVKKGDVLADIETDKATMELESYKEGKLLYIGAQKGEKISVNSLLAIIGDDKKVDVEKIVAAAKGGIPAASAVKAETTSPTQSASPVTAAPAETVSAAASNGRVKASPLAKKLAAEKGIDISKVPGSGDGGRVIKSDVDNYTPATEAGRQASEVKTPAVTQIPSGLISFDEVPVSQMRKVIAKRLAESKFSAPHFYLTMSIDMDKAVESRAKINEVSPVKISFNDIVLKATAAALKKHPAVNSSWLGDKIRINHHVNIGVAVAVED
ncbi:MAG: biotin/lipoyl-containing protein, partial [Bacteroidota bacterium]